METIETGEFNLQPDKHKRKGNWKGKLAAALAGVIGASVIGPSIASLIPETVQAAETKDVQVKTWTELKDAINGANSGDTVNVQVMNVLAAESAITIKNGVTVNLSSYQEGNEKNIQTIYVKKDDNENQPCKIDNWFYVESGATFNVTDINMSGKVVEITHNNICRDEKVTKKVSEILDKSKNYHYTKSAGGNASKLTINGTETEVRANTGYGVAESKMLLTSGGTNITIKNSDVVINGQYNPGDEITNLEDDKYYYIESNNMYLGWQNGNGRLVWTSGPSGKTGEFDTHPFLWHYKNGTFVNELKQKVIYFDGKNIEVADLNGEKEVTEKRPVGCDASAAEEYTHSNPISLNAQMLTAEPGNQYNDRGYFIKSKGDVKIDNVTISDMQWGSTLMGEWAHRNAPIYIEDGTFTMESGNIVNNSIGYLNEQYNDWYSGQTADTIMNKVIYGLQRTDSAGAIYFAGGKGYINGGKILGNKSDTGAIVVKTKTSGEANQAEVTLGVKGDESKKPIIGGNIGIHYAGAVYVNSGEDNDTAIFNMYGGAEIKDNFTWYKGGAVFVSSEQDGYGHGTKSPSRNATFLMDGGIIDNNTAIHRGGAIEVMSDQVYLKAGQITNNNSRVLGGAIYLEGDRADRTYTLYLPSTYITGNHAWTETGYGSKDQDPNDYPYLQRKLLYGVGALKESGSQDYTYDNPIGNVRGNESNINRGSANAVYEGSSDKQGKMSWVEDLRNEPWKWDLSDGKTNDYTDYANYTGNGGGIWTCSLGGYASINYVSGNTSGAVIDGNKVHRNNSVIDNDITAHTRDGGFIVTNSEQNATGDTVYKTTNRDPNVFIEWNKLYTGGDFDIINTADDTDPTNGGTTGILIKDNNARNGGAIAANGKLLLGKAKDFYEHRAEVEFEKEWEKNVTAEPVAFQMYIDGVAVPGYQFVLDGEPDSQGNENQEALTNVYESAPYKATISLPNGYNDKEAFTFTPDGSTDVISTLNPFWSFTADGGTIVKWNVKIEEVPTGSKTFSVDSSKKYLLVKKNNNNNNRLSIDVNDRDFNFRTASGENLPPTSLSNGTNIGAAVGSSNSVIINGFADNNNKDLYFIRSIDGAEISENSLTLKNLLNGDYALVEYTSKSQPTEIIVDGETITETVETWTCGTKYDFTISEKETKFDISSMEKPDRVEFSDTSQSNDPYGYGPIFGQDTVFTTHTTTAKAVRSNKNSGTSLTNNERTEPEVEKYINKKVDQTLSNITEKFTYDIMYRLRLKIL